MATAAAVVASSEHRAPAQITLNPWEIAKARFISDLDEKERETFNEATLENIYYSACNIERDDRGKSKCRATIQKLQPLVAAIEDYGKAIDAYANIASQYLAPIWGSIRVVLVMASNYGKFYSRIVDTFGRIGDILPRLRDYERIFDSTKHQRLIYSLSAVYLDIIVLCSEFRSLLLTQKASSVARVFKPLSVSINTQLEAAITRFRDHRSEVEKEAELCHMIEAAEARALVLRDQALAETREREANWKRLLEYISTTDYEYKHRKMQKIRHAETGAWFTKRPEFLNWMNCNSSSIMCCYGIPGCGKSVLTSSVIDEYMSLAGDLQTSTAIAYYYCDHADKRTLDPIKIFSAITRQLLCYIGNSPAELCSMIEGVYQDNSRIPDMEDIRLIIVAIIEKLPMVAIFIDGLDEVLEDERKMVFSFVRGVITQVVSTAIKLFVSSREDTTYLTTISSSQTFKVQVVAGSIAQDISSYIQHSIEDLLGTRDLVVNDPGLKAEIFQALVSGAKGMFLWVKFQLDELCAVETDDAIRGVLKNLPRDLSETYDRLLGRIIGEQRQELIRRMFSWIIYARRPLHMDEVREAIAFTIDDVEWNASKIPTDLSRLVRACGNLVIIDEDTEVIQLAHYTVQQYLLGYKTRQASSFHVTLEQANNAIGEVCVTYLSFSDFDTQLSRHVDHTTACMAKIERVIATQPLVPYNNTVANAARMLGIFRKNKHTRTNIDFRRQLPQKNPPSIGLTGKYTLLSYVTDNWLWHTNHFSSRPAQRGRRERLFNSLVLQKQRRFDVRPWDNLVFSDQGLSNIAPIGWAIYANHLPLLSAVSEGDHPSTYIDAATRWVLGDVDELDEPKLELSDDMLRNVQDRTLDLLYTPNDWLPWLYFQLLNAAKHGHLDIIEFCLNGWDSNVPTSKGFTTKSALKAHLVYNAALYDQASFASTMCELEWSHITIGTSNGLLCNALERAALMRNWTTVRALHSVGCIATPAFMTTIMRSLRLQSAVATDDNAAVEAMLESVIILLELGFSAESAVATYQVRTSELGPDENSRPAEARLNLLCLVVLAASHGHAKTLSTLLRSQIWIASFSAPYAENSWQVALTSAIQNDQFEIVKLLLQMHAFEELRSDLAPLSIAAAKGNLEVLETLISSGFRFKQLFPNQQRDHDRQTSDEPILSGFDPLSGFVSGEYMKEFDERRIFWPTEVIKTLSTTINSHLLKPAFTTAPLYAAAACGNLSIVRTLLERGVSPDERSSPLAGLLIDNEKIPVSDTYPAQVGSFLSDSHCCFISNYHSMNPNRQSRILNAGLRPIYSRGTCYNEWGNLYIDSHQNFMTAGISELEASAFESHLAMQWASKRTIPVLHYLSPEGDPQSIQFNFNHHPSKQIPTKSWQTPLTVAALNGNLEVVKCLLAAGSNIDAPDSDGNTALLLASCLGHLKVVEHLLLRKAKLQHSLIGAVAHEQVEILRCLMAAGADVKAKNSCGYYALMIALMMDNADIIDVLFDLTMENIPHLRLIVDSILFDWPYRLDRIVSHRKDRLRVDPYPVWDTFRLSYLGHRYLNIDQCFEGMERSTEITPLILAVILNRLSCAEALLAAGCPTEKGDSYLNRTPLLFAIEGGRGEMFKLLSWYGANMEAKDFRGLNAARSAARVGGYIRGSEFVDERMYNYTSRQNGIVEAPEFHNSYESESEFSYWPTGSVCYSSPRPPLIKYTTQGFRKMLGGGKREIRSSDSLEALDGYGSE